MKRCSIIIHSVAGNCYILGSYFQELLENRGVDARLYRVEDDDLHIWAGKLDTANQFHEEILSLPVAGVETLLKSDMVILGCPTRFGCPTAEMKAFLDATYPLVENQELAGRLFACFTSCVHSAIEGVHALDGMVYWAQAQGMVHIPLGTHTSKDGREDQPSTGIVHLGGLDGVIRPSQRVGEIMSCYADTLASHLQE